MILVDTSVWIDHFQTSNPKLELLLLEEQILIHPFVIGELSLGYLPKRDKVLPFLKVQPQLSPATDSEVLDWIERYRLFGKGIGWVDAHLLVSCLLNSSEFWTNDKALLAVSHVAGIKAHSHD